LTTPPLIPFCKSKHTLSSKLEMGHDKFVT
jgi:hypothetical protein